MDFNDCDTAEFVADFHPICAISHKLSEAPSANRQKLDLSMMRQHLTPGFNKNAAEQDDDCRDHSDLETLSLQSGQPLINYSCYAAEHALRLPGEVHLREAIGLGSRYGSNDALGSNSHG